MISQLKYNWNGYGADNNYPIQNAELVINSLDTLENKYSDIVWPEVVPTTRNSVQLKWYINNKYLEVEIYYNKITTLFVLYRMYDKAPINYYDIEDIDKVKEQIATFMAFVKIDRRRK